MAQIEIHEYSCIPITAEQKFVVFSQSEPTKDLTFTRFSALDSTRCLTTAETFLIDGNSLSTYSSWLTQGSSKLTVNGADDVNVKYSGTHTFGRATENFELVVCAMTQPTFL